MKSDNPAEIGQHVFARAGLGVAPFRVVGFERRVFQAAPDAPVQPGASCAYCGTGISECCRILSADGRRFVVGTTCVDKTHDAGLIKAYKRTPEYRAHQRALRQAKDARVVAEWERLMADPAARAVLEAKIVPTWNHQGTETWLAFAEKAWGWCGAAGHARYLKTAREILVAAQK